MYNPCFICLSSMCHLVSIARDGMGLPHLDLLSPLPILDTGFYRLSQTASWPSDRDQGAKPNCGGEAGRETQVLPGSLPAGPVNWKPSACGKALSSQPHCLALPGSSGRSPYLFAFRPGLGAAPCLS